jgi:hypothetical protein
MSVDERLRIGLSRNALSFDPDVQVLLESTLARRRRARRLRWVGAATGVLAAACAATVLVLSGGWPGDRLWPSVPADGTTASVTLEGRYAGEVAALPAAPSVAGRWVLEFKAQGVLAVSAPPAYPGVVSGVLYSIEGEELRTDLFSQDLCSGKPLGRYTVTGTGTALTLTTVDDSCPQRVAVLAETSWTATP